MEVKNRGKVWLPVIMATCIVVGLLMGTLMSRHSMVGNGKGFYTNKISALLSLIDSKYVDSVDQKKLVEDLMPKILGELDPHSVYISAEERVAANEQIEGSFSGIGVQFIIQNDTVCAVSIVTGGPSERAGLRPGDRIVSIDNKSFVGKSITNDLVLKTLRGNKGTTVKIGIHRLNSNKIWVYNVIRDDIPLYSVDARYKIGKDIGYVKIGNFGRQAHAEFLKAMVYLQKQNCNKFIIDLRGNPGGLMESALDIANEFLPKGRLILYTQGKAYPREDSYSNGKGSFQNNPLVILTDEWSASSSEILAGAIQDNDRGYVIGLRSYGKGLVQNEIPFRDGSAVRLTIARFYIPSGRCIQKPYVKGQDENYEMDIMNRYLKGEFTSKDKIHVVDSLRFKTAGGRIVYGGGGIIPDYFVPLDTVGATVWYNQVVNSGLVNAFAFAYTDAHREVLKTFKDVNKLSAYLDKQNLVSTFVEYAARKNIIGQPFIIEKSYPLVQNQIEAYIERNILSEDAFWMSYQKKDVTLLKAVEVISGMKHGTVLGRRL